MACGVHLGIVLVCLVLAVHVSCQKVTNYKVVQFNAREGRRQHVGHPQDQLRQVQLTGSNREAVIQSRGNAASNNRHGGGSMRPLPQPSNNRVPSNSRPVFAVRKPSAEPNQKPNRGTTVMTKPRVQEQANGYTRLLSYQQPNAMQSAARKPFTPAKTPALYGQTAYQSGPGARSRTSSTVRAVRLNRRRGSKVSQRGQTQQLGPNKYGTLGIQSFYDPVDPRYKQTINYVIPSAYGRVTIKRLKPTNRLPQQNAAPQRQPPNRQSQRVWTPRTRS